MSDYSIKNQEKVLKKLISLCEESPAPWLYRPIDFEKNFPFVKPEILISILAILESKGYIRVVYADLPDNFNIETIEVTQQGLYYVALQKPCKREFLLKNALLPIAVTIITSLIIGGLKWLLPLIQQ